MVLKTVCTHTLIQCLDQMRYTQSIYHIAWHPMSLNKWDLIQCFKCSFCPGRAESTPGTWSAYQCHINATTRNSSATGQVPFLWPTPVPSATLVFNLQWSHKKKWVFAALYSFPFFDRVISMRLTDQENAIDIVSLIPAKHLMKTFITYKMGVGGCTVWEKI